MDDLARLQARTESLEELKRLFAAMQALAASEVQSAQSALHSIRAYTDTIEQAIRDAARLQPPTSRAATDDEPTGKSALVVVGSERGFAGPFNRLLLERARSSTAPGEAVILVGQRCASIAGEHGIKASWIVSTATHIGGLPTTARRLSSYLSDYTTVRAIFGQYQSGSRFEPALRQILPPAPEMLGRANGRAAPLHQLTPALLLHQLIGELLLAELMLVLTESFASENAARLQIMQSAGHNITDKLDILGRQIRDRRQNAITTELLEVISGGEAIAGRPESGD